MATSCLGEGVRLTQRPGCPGAGSQGTVARSFQALLWLLLWLLFFLGKAIVGVVAGRKCLMWGGVSDIEGQQISR